MDYSYTNAISPDAANAHIADCRRQYTECLINELFDASFIASIAYGALFISAATTVDNTQHRAASSRHGSALFYAYRSSCGVYVVLERQ